VVNPSQQTAWLLITDTWYPGWRATVNREPVPVLQANGAFRAVPIPPGEAVVRMDFRPRGWWIGQFVYPFLPFFIVLIHSIASLKRREKGGSEA